MFRRPWTLVVIALLAALTSSPSLTWACPFCSAVSQTLSEEFQATDAVVVAELIQPPPPPKESPDGRFDSELSKAVLRIVQVVKGQDFVEVGESIETIYFGQAAKGTIFLMMGVDAPQLQWSTPVQLTDRGRVYVNQLMKLPESGAERLAFFQEHLEDRDDMLARDAYDEFARSPYDDVKALKPRMNRDQLVAWIQDDDIPASRRRLYLTMLGVCGGPDDLPMLESLLRSSDRRQKAGLDALTACYLTLRGADGLELIEELFLKNKEAEYADTYAAIMALRFHGTEADIIPRERIVKGLHYMLERPQLADLIIPDLARWEDWSQIDRLVALFKEADEKSVWVRVPVINYLRACPLPEAQKHMEELEKIDPAAMQRAKTFFPFGPDAKK